MRKVYAVRAGDSGGSDGSASSAGLVGHVDGAVFGAWTMTGTVRPPAGLAPGSVLTIRTDGMPLRCVVVGKGDEYSLRARLAAAWMCLRWRP